MNHLPSEVKRAVNAVSLRRIKETFDELSQIGRTKTGMNRLAYTESHKRATLLVMEWMKEAGLEVHRDPLFNVFGKRDGMKGLRSIVTGSHIDTVRDGGRFDGSIGVLAGLECMRVMSENEVPNIKPVELAVFASEESTRFNMGTIGSKAIVGDLTQNLMRERKDSQGISLFEAVRSFGGEPEKVAECTKKASQIDAILELHIEQGPNLERLGKDVGVVLGVVSVDRLLVNLKGQAIHSGGGEMKLRRDALAGASEIVLYCEKLAKEHGSSIRATVGNVTVYPGSLNTVPGEATLGIDLRAYNTREKYLKAIEGEIRRVCTKRNLTFTISSVYHSDYQRMSPDIVELIKTCAKELGLDYCSLPSFAGHDAAVIGKVAKSGMIFIPSKGGISHNWAEWTDFKYVRKGTQLLLASLLMLAGLRHA